MRHAPIRHLLSSIYRRTMATVTVGTGNTKNIDGVAIAKYPSLLCLVRLWLNNATGQSGMVSLGASRLYKVHTRVFSPSS